MSPAVAIAEEKTSTDMDNKSDESPLVSPAVSSNTSTSCSPMSSPASASPINSSVSASPMSVDNNDNYIGDDNEKCGIRDVWASNLNEEFQAICRVVEQFPYVAMDTEFPGVVARPLGDFKSSTEYQYQLLKLNVDMLKIIQLGLTFMNGTGELPPGITTWQFNFKFDLDQDMYAEDSVSLLTNSGIKFDKHEADGIDPDQFAEMLYTSGVVLMENVRWVSFHSGYDFGYLLKILTCSKLPAEEKDFFSLLHLFFPGIYDVKYLMKSCKSLKGGLQEVAELLGVDRIGPQHQAGSDALLTGKTFFKMTEMFFEDSIDDTKYLGHLYGLGTNHGEGSVAGGGWEAPPGPTAGEQGGGGEKNEEVKEETPPPAALQAGGKDPDDSSPEK